MKVISGQEDRKLLGDAQYFKCGQCQNRGLTYGMER